MYLVKMSAARMLSFGQSTPLAPGAQRQLSKDMGALAKAIVFSLPGRVEFSGVVGKRTVELNDGARAFKNFEEVLKINWAFRGEKNKVLLDEYVPVEAREMTPVDGEDRVEVITYDASANIELWSLLFLVCQDHPRALVMEYQEDRDGRRALMRLRCEYKLGQDDRSIADLERRMVGVTITDEESPSEPMRAMCEMHDALKVTQVYRTDAMLHRALLSCIDGARYGHVCMELRRQSDAGELTTASLIHQVQRSFDVVEARPAPLRSRGAAMAGAEAVQGQAPTYNGPVRPAGRCDVCRQDGTAGVHYVRDCPLVARARLLEVAERPGAAGAAVGAWSYPELQNFWDEDDEDAFFDP